MFRLTLLLLPQTCLLLLGTLQPGSLLVHLVCARMDGLLPAATLRPGPPGQVGGASSVVAGLAVVLAVIPICSCVWVGRLQGVAFASSMPTTEWTAIPCMGSSSVRVSRPAVHLPCWALGTEPEDLLGTFQPYFIRKVFLSCVALVVPLC